MEWTSGFASIEVAPPAPRKESFSPARVRISLLIGHVSFRVLREFLAATRGTEEVSVPLVLDLALRFLFIDLHSANGIACHDALL